MRAYPAVPPLGDLVELLPPAPASVAVTQVSKWDFNSGTVPLVPAEGVPIVIGIGALDGGRLTLLLSMDHRTHDPEHLALLRDGLRDELREDLTHGR